MKKTKSERHHWWPQCVSRRWAGDDGGVSWLSPDGTERRAKPENFGVIGNGHFIKLGNTPGEATAWDQNFESEFQRADSNFPSVIAWLEGLKYETRFGQQREERFLPQFSPDDLFGKMIESITSLAIRSPMTRFVCANFAERLRGPLPEQERNALIAINMRDMHRRAVHFFGLRGKATAVLSPDKEFIFGDGFFHNFGTLSGPPTSGRILVPLTPRLAVIYALPMMYSEPRLSTLVIEADETERLNNVIQIYARDAIFFRSERPTLLPEFEGRAHRMFDSSDNIVDLMIRSMPGLHRI